MVSSCVYDPPRAFFYIYNYSDEAVYYYDVCNKSDSIPQKPRLSLFHNVDDINKKDKLGNPIFSSIVQPGYRIDAYDVGKKMIWGTRNNPEFPDGVKEITLFFITEKTMRENNWRQIYDGQLYESKVTLTEDELKSKCWRYTYIPSDTSINKNQFNLMR